MKQQLLLDNRVKSYFGKYPIEKEKQLMRELWRDIQDAYSNMAVPPVVFNPEETKAKILRAKEILERLL